MKKEQVPSGPEIINTRLMEATREAVFAAFVDRERLARWWGPEGFTNTFDVFEPRPGGSWTYVMHGPDGTDYRNESEFVEIVEPERIVVDHLRPMHRFRLTITLDAEAEGTRLVWRMQMEKDEGLDEVLYRANEQNLDRLAVELRTSR